MLYYEQTDRASERDLRRNLAIGSDDKFPVCGYNSPAKPLPGEFASSDRGNRTHFGKF
jgi:hypothetical protein